MECQLPSDTCNVSEGYCHQMISEQNTCKQVPSTICNVATNLRTLPALKPTQPPIQWVPEVHSSVVKRGRGVTLTTHPNLVPTSRMSWSVYLLPLVACIAVAGQHITSPEDRNCALYWQIERCDRLLSILEVPGSNFRWKISLSGRFVILLCVSKDDSGTPPLLPHTFQSITHTDAVPFDAT
jgi:hypothetical protein